MWRCLFLGRLCLTGEGRVTCSFYEQGGEGQLVQICCFGLLSSQKFLPLGKTDLEMSLWVP